ncbi:glycosyltransferase family 4 protein [Micromonospora sp. CA-244673]|uniref:glycosyltransferase family 4 protein n=1 Tax=Micromonospora sp. CA-244673 TaxID=3239958 RepID=UPI003D8AD331
MAATGEGAPPAPARIVILVDNGVNGDSRVQKTAKSAADAGWDVILLGRSPNGQPQSWQLGAAKVQLVRMPSPLKQRRHEFRRRWLTGPLAYPPTGVAAYRQQEVRAWQADLRVRRAALAGGGGSTLARQGLRAQELAAKVTRKWISFRHWQLTRGQTKRKTLSTPSDRAYTWLQLRLRGDRAWRKLEPQLWDYELAFGRTVDELKPDIIYANDFRMIGVGARAKIRAAAKGRTIKLIWDVHEYLPGVKPRADNARWMVANRAHEHEYARHADAVITVSERLAEFLKRDHHLPELPSVVLNTPHAADALGAATGDGPDIRTACGLGPDVPLVVYSGAAAAHRGMGVMVEALPRLPGVHVAFVVNAPTGPYLTSLKKRAAELGAADRLHVLPYVTPAEVVGFLSTATVGVIPIHHWLNHEIQLITKFFEYSHARLPIVVSDVETMAATVRQTGQGEVFRVNDVDEYVRAIEAVVADPQRYRKAYESMDLAAWTWEEQAKVQNGLYHRLAPQGRRPALPESGGLPVTDELTRL